MRITPTLGVIVIKKKKVGNLVVGVDGPLVVCLDQEVVVEPPMFVVVHLVSVFRVEL